MSDNGSPVKGQTKQITTYPGWANFSKHLREKTNICFIGYDLLYSF